MAKELVYDPALLQQGKTDIAFCHGISMPVQRTKRRASAWLRRDMLSCGKIGPTRRREQRTPPLRFNAGRYRLPGNYRSMSY